MLSTLVYWLDWTLFGVSNFRSITPKIHSTFHIHEWSCRRYRKSLFQPSYTRLYCVYRLRGWSDENFKDERVVIFSHFLTFCALLASIFILSKNNLFAPENVRTERFSLVMDELRRREIFTRAPVFTLIVQHLTSELDNSTLDAIVSESEYLMTMLKRENENPRNYLINVAVNCFTLGFTMRKEFLIFRLSLIAPRRTTESAGPAA